MTRLSVGMPALLFAIILAAPAFAAQTPVPAVSQDLLRQRDQLREQFRKSFVELKDIADIEETKGEITVDLYVNRFFMPNSSILHNDGLLALNQLVALLRKRSGKRVHLRSVFKASRGSLQFENDLSGFHSPHGSVGAQFIRMEDSIPEALAVQRSIIIFSYILSGSFQDQSVTKPAKT
jgi:hypothetical protein